MKLRPHLVKFGDITATRILREIKFFSNSTSQKMSLLGLLAILEVLMIDFSKFEQVFKFTKIQNSESLKL